MSLLKVVKIKWTIFAAVLALSVVSFTKEANCDYTQRFSLGAGIATTGNPSQTSFDLGLEYEYRFQPDLGIGAFGEHIFSSPGFSIVGFPEIFWHPFSTDLLLSGAPIVRFGSGIDTDFGVRLGTRLPIPLGILTIVPIFAVDLISGGPDYIYGLGIGL